MRELSSYLFIYIFIFLPVMFNSKDYQGQYLIIQKNKLNNIPRMLLGKGFVYQVPFID